MKKSRSSAARKLTPRQLLFAKSLVKGTTITDAARNAGYSGKNLAQSGHQALKTVQSKMPELFEEAGLTPRVLIQKYLVPLLDATTTKFCQYKGRFTDSVIVADNHTRLLALDMAFRLIGAYATSESVTFPEPSIKVIVTDAPRSSPPAIGVLCGYTTEHSRVNLKKIATHLLLEVRDSLGVICRHSFRPRRMN